MQEPTHRFAYEPSGPGQYSVAAGFPNHPPGHLGNESPAKGFWVVR
jgi:hypothetical protein